MAASAIVLREDDRGIPRSLPLLAAFVEEEARRCAAAASQPARSDVVRAFRGLAAPKISICDFLERIHLLVWSEAASGHAIRIDGTCFMLAGVYLTRFIGSHAARVAGIQVEPSTAHRLVAVALFLGGHSPKNWAAAFEAASYGAIRTCGSAGSWRSCHWRRAAAAPVRRGRQTRSPETRRTRSSAASALACHQHP